MSLPPLQATPHLSRLLVPDEEVIYTAKLHPLFGWLWLLAALVCGFLGVWVKPLWIFALLLGWVYALPFRNFEMAITTQRILLRRGRFGVSLESVNGAQLKEWVVHQNLLQTLLHSGTVLLKLKDENRTIKLMDLPGIWHPLTLVEALETLQREELKET